MQGTPRGLERLRFLHRHGSWRESSHERAGVSAYALTHLFWLVADLLFELLYSYYASGIVWFIDVNLDNFELLETNMKADHERPVSMIFGYTFELLNLQLFSVGHGGRLPV